MLKLAMIIPLAKKIKRFVTLKLVFFGAKLADVLIRSDQDRLIAPAKIAYYFLKLL